MSDNYNINRNFKNILLVSEKLCNVKILLHKRRALMAIRDHQLSDH